MPPARATYASLPAGWEPMGYLTPDKDPELPTAARKHAAMIELQDMVNRMIAKQEIPETFKLPDTTKSTELKLSFSMLTWNEEARDLYFGSESAGAPLDGESKAILGLECSNEDYHRAWQHRTEDMLAAETARQYGSFRRRYALGLDYVAGP